MPTSSFVVKEAEINKRWEAAWKAGDLAEMQKCTAELTALYRAYYGSPQAEL